jgi:hypothetical protein
VLSREHDTAARQQSTLISLATSAAFVTLGAFAPRQLEVAWKLPIHVWQLQEVRIANLDSGTLHLLHVVIGERERGGD